MSSQSSGRKRQKRKTSKGKLWKYEERRRNSTVMCEQCDVNPAKQHHHLCHQCDDINERKHGS